MTPTLKRMNYSIFEVYIICYLHWYVYEGCDSLKNNLCKARGTEIKQQASCPEVPVHSVNQRTQSCRDTTHTAALSSWFPQACLFLPRSLGCSADSSCIFLAYSCPPHSGHFHHLSGCWFMGAFIWYQWRTAELAQCISRGNIKDFSSQSLKFSTAYHMANSALIVNVWPHLSPLKTRKSQKLNYKQYRIPWVFPWSSAKGSMVTLPFIGIRLVRKATIKNTIISVNICNWETTSHPSLIVVIKHKCSSEKNIPEKMLAEKFTQFKSPGCFYVLQSAVKVISGQWLFPGLCHLKMAQLRHQTTLSYSVCTTEINIISSL